MRYIHERSEWPNFEFDFELISNLVGRVQYRHGYSAGKMEGLGMHLYSEAKLETLSNEVLKTGEIEGEKYASKEVRSSIARRIGLKIPDMVRSSHEVDGIVDVMYDTSHKAHLPLSTQRLFDWHNSMFPFGKSGMLEIQVGEWRDDTKGPMQVVSGPMGKERVHFQAVHSKRIPEEMERFIKWFNEDLSLNPLVKSGVAHLWFLTIHPFDDGNGRIARALSDMLLTQASYNCEKFYSLSSQIRLYRRHYYEQLEKAQKGDLDITEWLVWFLECVERAIIFSEDLVNQVLRKHDFWQAHKHKAFNERQIKMLNILLDDFFGKLSTSKWAKMMKCSTDTALRDIQDLVQKKALKKDPESGGRSTNYLLRFG